MRNGSSTGGLRKFATAMAPPAASAATALDTSNVRRLIRPAISPPVMPADCDPTSTSLITATSMRLVRTSAR
ncbi:hypothetical protein [Kibdelosporangium philippinense]|uniref:hypothetical protein n=1 Tax=Kibdelosporangium philippinense TaxID=211113 RepID=UPI00360F756C